MKKFLAGFIVCFILMLGTAYATKTFDIAKFKIFVNGNEYIPNDKPVLIGGRTYLSLRGLGEALGVRVTWNSDKKCVEVGEPPVYNTPIAQVTPSPTSAVVLEKNEFIAHDNMRKMDTFKVSVLGKVGEGTTKSGTQYEIWHFKFKNITNVKQCVVPFELRWNKGGRITVMALEGYENIKERPFGAGEEWECIAQFTINPARQNEPIKFAYENGNVIYQE